MDQKTSEHMQSTCRESTGCGVHAQYTEDRARACSKEGTYNDQCVGTEGLDSQGHPSNEPPTTHWHNHCIESSAYLLHLFDHLHSNGASTGQDGEIVVADHDEGEGEGEGRGRGRGGEGRGFQQIHTIHTQYSACL